MATTTTDNVTIPVGEEVSQVNIPSRHEILSNLFSYSELLNKAIEKKDIAATKMLLDSIGNFDTDEKFNTLTNVLQFDSETVDKLIEEGKVTDKYKNELLLHACERNNKALVTLLLKQGANVNYINNRTPLIVACRNNHQTFSNLEIIKLLLDNGADMCIENRNGDSALLSAPYNDYNPIETVKLLLDNGADVNYQSKITKRTALIGACGRWTENVELIKLLVDRGADVELRCNSGTGKDMLNNANKHLLDRPPAMYYGLRSNKQRSDISLPLMKSIRKNGFYYYVFPLELISHKDYKLPGDKHKCLSYLVDSDTTEGIFEL